MRPHITGIGIVSPFGIGVEPYWTALLESASGIGPITRFDGSRYATGIAGEYADFDPRAHLPARLLPQTDRITQFALIAAGAALGDAAIPDGAYPEYASAVVTANNSGGFEFAQKEMQALWSKGPAHVSAYQSFAWFYAVNTGQVSIRHGLKGAARALVTDDTGGMEAVGQARRQLRHDCELVLAGAVDTNLCPWGWSAYTSARLMTTERDPSTAYRPFAPDADGFVSGEGGAIMTVERPDGAGARTRYAEIAGFASTFDGAAHDGRGLERAIRAALRDAEVDTGEVDTVFADGFGTRDMDDREARAITAVFGPRGVPVTVPKTGIGRLGCAGSALDVATACLAIAKQVVPPTPRYELSPAASALRIVDRPFAGRVDTVLVLARGRGGFNSAMVLTKPRI
ncbi:MAG TPA: beta-ketoacyl synthase N-terminal-like domain-containing protein [Actinophytocola sp.]|uniref:beta-ketoacyl synthase N-terminal-like domain-containing protein n=1 Tax=Actinophytocola sp. TaxID=1872138 RepID=UPI002DBF9AD8|nr:beta-ketoacyl synthase N-terminal-like domain-containing protein [Actinophytocola sp.]HEU5473633.1 beta-ketoacyl synthase N-terminal-like domain-containing protein [Actinophytocola sp.]